MADVPRIGHTIYERAVMLDTGPLISLYDPNDNRGEAIHALLKELQRERYPICICLLTVAEAHRRILYDVCREKALEFLKAIFDGSIEVVHIGDEDISSAVGIIERYGDQDLSYTDAVSMAVMKRIGIQKVLSYDHHFWVLNFTRLP